MVGIDSEDEFGPALRVTKKPKGKSLRDIGRGMTPEQELMRDEMEAGVHKSGIIVNDIKSQDFSSEEREPVRLGEVLDEVVGMPMDEDVRAEALQIINEHGTGLVLNWQQWPIVTKLVEAGIISGRAGS